VAPVALVAWVAAGPLAGNWAARAGTPPTLIAAVHGTSTAAAATQGSGSTSLQAPFTGRLDGTVRQGVSPTSGLATIDLRMRISGGVNGALDVQLAGQPLGGGGVTMTQSSVSLGTGSEPSVYTGHILALHGSRMLASVSGAGGASMRLQIDLSLDEATGKVSGTVQAEQGGPGGRE
jgi:hypothetical protein